MQAQRSRSIGHRGVHPGALAAVLVLAPFAVAAIGVATVAAAGPERYRIHVSSTTHGVVGGIAFADEDVLTFDSTTGSWSMLFDGSDVSLRSCDVDAIAVLDDGDPATLDAILMSVRGPRTISGLDGRIDDSDIVRFTRRRAGASPSSSTARTSASAAAPETSTPSPSPPTDAWC